MYDQTAEHLSRSGLYPLLQSAYRAGHSTETALLKVQNDILLAMDRQHVTLLVLLDLSAAFDTVDHQVLLRRLEVTYGITGTALQWFRSYLTGRTQRVYINQTYSDDFALPHGVPQGSCLGPLLFTMYASKLFEVVESSSRSPRLCRRQPDISIVQAGFRGRGAGCYRCSSRLHHRY